MLCSFRLVKIPDGHLGELDFQPKAAVGADGGADIGDVGFLQAAGLGAVSADISLHAETVDQGTTVGIIGLNAFDQRHRGIPLLGHEHIVVIIEEFDISAQLFHGVAGAEESIFHIIIAHISLEVVRSAVPDNPDMAGIRSAPVRCAVADRFIYYIPAVNDAGKGFLEMGDDLVDIGCQALTVHFLGGERF